jgi:hypothetical protein
LDQNATPIRKPIVLPTHAHAHGRALAPNENLRDHGVWAIRVGDHFIAFFGKEWTKVWEAGITFFKRKGKTIFYLWDECPQSVCLVNDL